jgi:hypothetical protein
MQRIQPARRSVGLPSWRRATLVVGAALALAASGGTTQANNLVQNGSFSLTSGTDSGSSAQFGTGYLNGSNPYLTVTNWATSGYNFLFVPQTGTTSGTSADNSGATGSAGNLSLWGPGNGSANGLINSPDGGNFVGADSAYEAAAITQTIVGLIPNSVATLTFDWAAAQQSGFSGQTTDYWQVSLGSQTQVTATYTLPQHLFSGWMTQVMQFTVPAGVTSEVLSFLAVGTPISPSEPPFALLDGVSLSDVPEPASWALMVTGLTALIGIARWRRRSANAQARGAA